MPIPVINESNRRLHDEIAHVFRDLQLRVATYFSSDKRITTTPDGRNILQMLPSERYMKVKEYLRGTLKLVSYKIDRKQQSIITDVILTEGRNISISIKNDQDSMIEVIEFDRALSSLALFIQYLTKELLTTDNEAILDYFLNLEIPIYNNNIEENCRLLTLVNRTIEENLRSWMGIKADIHEFEETLNSLVYGLFDLNPESAGYINHRVAKLGYRSFLDGEEDESEDSDADSGL